MKSYCPYLVVGLIVLATTQWACNQAIAQEPNEPDGIISSENDAREINVEALMARVRARLERIDEATRERDEAIDFLENQIDAATDRISGTGETNQSLRTRAAALNTEVEDLAEDRDRLNEAVNEREQLLERLRQQVASLELELGEQLTTASAAEEEVARLETALTSEQQRSNDLEATLASLRSERQTLAEKVDIQESQAAELEQELAGLKSNNQRLVQDIRSSEQSFEELEAGLQARIAALDREVVTKETALKELSNDHAATVDDLERANASIARLSDQLDELTQQLGAVEGLLVASESRVADQQGQIRRLGERLNLALAQQVEELSQYRSEFFGRLKQALGEDSAFRIVGDRFVFPSEVLFSSGSARLDPAGREELEQLAQTLNDVTTQIPSGLDWILRVDGHTDRVPIVSGEFQSNWELSTARAISVVRELIDMGVPAERLAATGFGEYQPIDPGNSPEAYSRNRRIEFKLTSS